MEEFLESAGAGAVWGVGFGLAGLLVTGFGRGLRPVAKTIVKGGIVASDWLRNVTEESRESLQDLYEEAKAERARPAAAPAAAPAPAPAERARPTGATERKTPE